MTNKLLIRNKISNLIKDFYLSKRLVSVSGPSLHRVTLRGSLEEIQALIQVRQTQTSCKTFACCQKSTLYLTCISSQVFRSHYCMEVLGHPCDTIDLPHYDHLVTEGNLQLGQAAYVVFQVQLSVLES